MSATTDKLYVVLCADGSRCMCSASPAWEDSPNVFETDAQAARTGLDLKPTPRNCGSHRVAVFVMVDAQGRRAYAQRREGEPRCETLGCAYRVTHGEHWYARKRYWCEAHVPMSGHYERCPDPCERLVAEAFGEVSKAPK